MVFGRKYRRSSEGVDVGEPVYQDKWTKMLYHREKYSTKKKASSRSCQGLPTVVKDFSAPQPTNRRDPPVAVLQTENKPVIFSIPLPSSSRRSVDFDEETKEESSMGSLIGESFVDMEETPVVEDKIVPSPKVIKKVVPGSKFLPRVVKKPVIRRRLPILDIRQDVVLKREKHEELSTIPQIATIASIGPKIRGQKKQEELRSIPQIATIASLGPQLMKCPPPPNQSANRKRRSNTDLPDWWKECVAQDRAKQQKTSHDASRRRATWHGEKTKRTSKKEVVRQRRSLFEKDISAASLLSGEFEAPRDRGVVSFASGSSTVESLPCSPEPKEKQASQGSPTTKSLLSGVIPLLPMDNALFVPESMSIPDSLGQAPLLSIEEEEPGSEEDDEDYDLDDQEDTSIVEPNLFPEKHGGSLHLGSMWPTMIVSAIVLIVAVGLDSSGMF